MKQQERTVGSGKFHYAFSQSDVFTSSFVPIWNTQLENVIIHYLVSRWKLVHNLTLLFSSFLYLSCFNHCSLKHDVIINNSNIQFISPFYILNVNYRQENT